MSLCPHEVDERACAACTPRDSAPTDPYLSRPFVASYAGTCVTCRDPIKPGDRIEALGLGYVHARSCS